MHSAPPPSACSAARRCGGRGRRPYVRAAGGALLAQQRPDFSGVDALASLAAASGPGLVKWATRRVHVDMETLAALARELETRKLAQGRAWSGRRWE